MASPFKPEWDAKGVKVHESAYIDDPDMKIGAGTRIWHFSHILPGVEIGENSTFGQNVVVGPRVKVGARCKVQNNVSLYEGVELEDGVFCGPSCVFTNVNNPRAEIKRKNEFAKTVVKRGASIGANATIVCGHDLAKLSIAQAQWLLAMCRPTRSWPAYPRPHRMGQPRRA